MFPANLSLVWDIVEPLYIPLFRIWQYRYIMTYIHNDRYIMTSPLFKIWLNSYLLYPWTNYTFTAGSKVIGLELYQDPYP